MKRGRKSVAELTVASVNPMKKAVEPPKNITKAQADIWKLTMTTAAGTMIGPEAYPVLVEYCRAVTQCDELGDLLDRFDPKWADSEAGLQRWNRLQIMHDRSSKRLVALATKLRISPQTRYSPTTASTVERNHDDSGQKPWLVDES